MRTVESRHVLATLDFDKNVNIAIDSWKVSLIIRAIKAQMNKRLRIANFSRKLCSFRVRIRVQKNC